MSNGAGVDCGCEIVWRVRVAERRLAGCCCCCCCSVRIHKVCSLVGSLHVQQNRSAPAVSRRATPSNPRRQAGCSGPSHSAATERVHGSKFTTYTRRASERALSALHCTRTRVVLHSLDIMRILHRAARVRLLQRAKCNAPSPARIICSALIFSFAFKNFGGSHTYTHIILHGACRERPCSSWPPHTRRRRRSPETHPGRGF